MPRLGRVSVVASCEPDCRPAAGRTDGVQPGDAAAGRRGCPARCCRPASRRSPGRSPGPGRSRCAASPAGEGLEQALAQLGRDAGAAVGDASARPACAVGRQRARARRPPCGLCLMALCSRLRVSSRSAHSWARTGARHGVELEVEAALRRSAAPGPAPPRARSRPSRPPARRPAGAAAPPWPAPASGWPAAVARSTVSLDLLQRLRAASTSPRCADCTCVFSTASGVRSWCEVSRTKRFWWASRWARRAITWLVASTSGSSSRGARVGGERRQVVLARAAPAAR